MGAVHRLGTIHIQYIPVVNRIKVVRSDGATFWTNSFDVIRKEIDKYGNQQLKLL